MNAPAAHRGPSLLLLISAFAAVYIIWGSTYLAIKFAIETLPPLLMAGVRFSIAGAILYAWMRWRGERKPSWRQWRTATVVGGFLLFGGNGLICWAQQYVASGLAALLVATVPLWMVVLDWLAFRGRRPTARISFGLAVGMLGVFVLVNPAEFIGQPIHLGGAIAVLIACVSWSVGSLYSRRAELPRSALISTGMQMFGGGMILIIGGSLRGEWSSVNLAAVSWQSTAAFIYLIAFGSLIGYTAYIWLLRVVSPAAVSTYAYVNPVVAVILGWMFANEPLNARTLLAAGLIIAAVVLITARRDKSKAVQSQPEPSPIQPHVEQKIIPPMPPGLPAVDERELCGACETDRRP